MSEPSARPGPPESGPGPAAERPAAGADGDRSFAQRTLDIVVFGPAGMVLTAVEDLPEFAAKGRSRLDAHLRNARTVGEFVVRRGRRGLEQRLGGEPVPRRPPAGPPAPPGPAAMTGEVTRTPEPSPRATHHGNGAGGGPGAPVDLAIPDYEALSASQVVRRLDGLAPSELDAVYRHEAATRRRRTILHRAQQLLGTEGPPGGADPRA